MKGTKELLILALPLMAVGCSGGGTATSPPPPPSGIDAEGIFEGTAGGGDSLFGIVAVDGTALFLEYPDTAAVPPSPSSGAIIVPTAVLPDDTGAFAVPFTSYANNGFTYPSGYTLASTFSGNANVDSKTLSLTYLTKNSAPAVFTTNYDQNNYENGPANSLFVGTYNATFNIGSVADSATVIIDDQGGVSVQEIAYSCNYSGTWSIPTPGRNAYEINFAYTACVNPLGKLSMTGLAALFNPGNSMFAIMYDKASATGIFFTMTKTG